MISIKDLRVGNLVGRLLKTYPDNIFEVLEVGETLKVVEGEEKYFFDYRDLEPIPLTEEWLVKLGFANEDYKDGYYGKTAKSQSLIYDFVVKIEDWGIFYELKGNLIVTIDSVHQLQNLYFALTNQELTLK